MSSCIMCKKALRKGDLVGRTTTNQFVHAGFQEDGSFCESGGVASGWWDGETYVAINWDAYGV